MPTESETEVRPKTSIDLPVYRVEHVPRNIRGNPQVTFANFNLRIQGVLNELTQAGWLLIDCKVGAHDAIIFFHRLP